MCDAVFQSKFSHLFKRDCVIITDFRLKCGGGKSKKKRANN